MNSEELEELKQEADNGGLSAMNELAEHYRDREYPYLEYKYVQMAAEHGDIEAARVFSIMNFHGIGCYEDNELAMLWHEVYKNKLTKIGALK
ncbi:hypothetical protein [Bathymodiolus japonicus methanotrophic gill symbiont]|uniref:hypothetical protein n=1 Tax=Bathymodiolus japonicus methanotrophic gill symbiont TaxID=113269 RepID=UPI001C8E7374|nr:hypothetical protein [Bathymodiolus japonicus methanotrophic gill symbiont]